MIEPRRRWRRALGLVALGAIGLVFLLRTERAGEFVCSELRDRLPAALGLDVTIGRCEIQPLSLGVRLETVAVSKPGAPSPLASADSAEVSLRGLFPGYVSLHEVTLVRPRVDVVAPKSEGGAEAEGCSLDALKRLRVGKLSVEQATLRVTFPQGQVLALDGLDVSASLGRRSAEVDAQARAGSAEVQGRILTLGQLQLGAELDLEDRELELQRLEANVEGLSLTASGRIESLCDALPVLALGVQAWVPLESLPRLGVPLEDPSGQVVSRVSISGRVDAPVVRGELQATQVGLGRFRPGDFSVKGSWSGQTVVVEEFATTSGEGQVRVSGELSLEKGLPVKAKVETRDASFARIMERAGVPGAWVEFAATTKGTVTGRLLPTPSLSGDIDFSTGPFILAARAWDGPEDDGPTILRFKQSTGSFRLGVSGEGVTFDDVRVRVGPQQATRVNGRVAIFYDANRGLDIDVNGEQVDLSDFGAIAELPWAGVGTARARIAGPMNGGGIVVDGQVTLRDFKLMGYSLGVVQSALEYRGDTLSLPTVVAQKGQTQYFGDVALSFRPAGLYTRATVQLPDGRVEDMVDLLADLSPMMASLQDGVLTGRVSGLAAVDSPAAQLTGVIATHVRDVRYFQRPLGEASIITRFEDGKALVLEPTRFAGALGKTSAGGRWEFAGPLDFTLGIEGGSLAELIDPGAAEGLPVSGAFTASAQVGGTADALLVDGWMESADAHWKGKALGGGRLEAKVVGLDTDVKGTVFRGLTADLHFKMKNDWPYTADLRIDLADLSPFLPTSAAQLGASVAGKVTATGQLLDFSQTQAQVRLEKLALSRGEFQASNVGPVELTWRTGAFDVRALHVKGPTSELVAEGTWGPSTVDLKARGALDLALLSSFIGVLDRTQGQLGFTAAFSGPVKDPTLVGNAEVSDVRFAVKGQDVQVRSLSGRANFSESRVLLQDVQGFVNDGSVRVRGDARLDGLDVAALGLQFDLSDVTFRVQPEVPVTVSGSLLLASRKQGAYQLSGALDVDRFRYTRQLSLDDLLAAARDRGVPSEEKPEEWLRFDVDVSASGDVRLDNNLIRSKLLGKVRLTGTNVKPVLLGAIEAGEGAQAYFRNNTYRISRGLLQFNGLWPTFDLSAQTTARDYVVNVKAFGRLDDPKLSLTSEPNLPEADILSLLTIGVTSRERLTSQSGASLAAEALLSASGLDQQVQRFLSENVGLKDQQVRFTTSFNETTGTSEPAVQWEAKVLDQNLKVGVTQPVTGRGTKAQAEYRINQRVSARAQWDNQNQNTSVGNPGLDLRFLFEWE
ncbi:MAG: translocation/assembly module TamB domain-containing protein [Myxococcota bacterium]